MNRANKYLLERYGYIGNYLGLLMLVMSAVMLFPVIVLAFVPGDYIYAPAFLSTAAIMAGIGLFLRASLGRTGLQALDFKESSIVVFITWASISVAGALPYMMISGMSFSHAVFDSISGWTTTGLSLLDIPKAPAIILFYRAWAQFIGGAGIAIIMLASLTGVGAQHIYSAEGKGTLIKPNVLASARIVVSLYLGYFFLGVTAYLLWGMNLLDAVVHCFAAISTGGFANYANSFGYYDSAMVEFITIVLMILGNLSFLTGYFIVKGKFKSIVRNGEIKVLTASLLLAIPIIFFGVTSHLYITGGKALRVAIFETVSAITTTGFSTVNYNDPNWFDSGIFIMIILQLIGGGTCSTAGGIKQYRVYMMYKSVLWHIKTSLRPSQAVTRNFIWEGDQKGYVSDNKFREIGSFVFLYMAIYIVGVSVIAFSTDPATGLPYHLRDAMFEFASSIGTVGLSIGVTSVNAPLQVVWAQSVGMLLGRLEIFVVFFALIKLFRDSLYRVSR